MVTATRKYGSAYGASPRNDKKFIEAARKPAVVQVVTPPPPPPPPRRTLAGQTRYWTERAHWFSQDQIGFILDKVIPEIPEAGWYFFTYYVHDAGYTNERAFKLAVDQARILKEQEERKARVTKELNEKWKDHQPTDAEIMEYSKNTSALRKVSESDSLCSCCGTMPYGSYPSSYDSSATGGSYYRRFWYSHKDGKGHATKHPDFSKHTEKLLLDSGDESFLIAWSDE